MTIELKIGQLNTSNASDGDLLSYVGANGIVEYRDVVSEIDARIVANVNSVQDNVTAVDNNAWVNANDYSTYTTVTALIDTVQANLTSVIDAAPSTLDTLAEIAAALENDANIAVTLTNQIGTVSANAATNATNIDLVQDNVDVVGASLDSFGLYANSTFALSNEAVTFADLEVANLVVEGDMTIIGDTTTIESNNVVITNPYLLLNNGISGANTLDSGIVIDRGSSSNVGLIWDEDSDSFTFITTDDGIEQAELTPTGNASIVVGGFSINDITFDVTTNVPADGQALVYVAANSAFEPGTVSSESSNLISDQLTVSTSNTFTLTSSVEDANNILVSLDGIIQNPNDDYIVSGSTLTIANSSPLPTGLELEVRHLPTSGGSGSGGGGSSGGITTGKALAMALIFGG